jgi:hypothetical protein
LYILLYTRAVKLNVIQLHAYSSIAPTHPQLGTRRKWVVSPWKTRYPLYRRLHGLRGPMLMQGSFCRPSSPPPPHTHTYTSEIQSTDCLDLASRYTDYAVAAATMGSILYSNLFFSYSSIILHPLQNLWSLAANLTRLNVSHFFKCVREVRIDPPSCRKIVASSSRLTAVKTRRNFMLLHHIQELRSVACPACKFYNVWIGRPF